mmetsp:Transcript_3650/g.14286  ORF Transcript_3650/g.14286 Transcript_3650/m.14286 type:complete len:141 (+) Transcript_3650:1176-1598(+)
MGRQLRRRRPAGRPRPPWPASWGASEITFLVRRCRRRGLPPPSPPEEEAPPPPHAEEEEEEKKITTPVAHVVFAVGGQCRRRVARCSFSNIGMMMRVRRVCLQGKNDTPLRRPSRAAQEAVASSVVVALGCVCIFLPFFF